MKCLSDAAGRGLAVGTPRLNEKDCSTTGTRAACRLLLLGALLGTEAYMLEIVGGDELGELIGERGNG